MTIDLNLKDSTNHYAVFGNPIQHSQSPYIHTRFALQTGLSLSYQAIEVPLNEFNDYVIAFLSQSGKGLNITIPFKEAAYSICTSLTKRAQQAGSVNTIWFDHQHRIQGDTTDGQGFIHDLTINSKINIKGKSVLVFGAGGAVKAILGPLSEQGPERIVIVNRTVERATTLAQKFADKIHITTNSYDQPLNGAFDLIINGTSLSLLGKPPPISKITLNENACCYDLMYATQPTAFMRWAKSLGAAKILDGLGMLVEQAAESFFIWHGVRADTALMINELRKNDKVQ